MPDKELKYKIGVDASDGIQGVQKFGRAVSQELSKVEDDFDDTASAGKKVAAALSGVADEIKANLEGSARAADALKAALGEVGDKANVDQIVSDLKRMGLTFEDIVADADDLAASLKKLDDVQVGAGAGADLDKVSTAAAETTRPPDELGKSASSSKSVLANMVGNTTQDLGALGGLAGSAGVAIGQMGEYMADAASEGEGLGSVMKNFAGVAVPVAGLALATQVLTEVMGRFSASQERTAKSVKLWEDALAKGGDASENYADSLRDLGAVTLDVTREQSKLANVTAELDSHWYTTGIGVHVLTQLLGASNDETKDVTKSLTQAGVTVDRWADLVAGGAAAAAKFAQFLKTTNLSADDQKNALTALAQAQEDHATATANQATAQKFFGDATKETSTHVKDLNDAYAAAARESTAFADAQAEGAAGAERINSLLRDQADALNAQADAAQSAADQQIDVQKALVNYGKVLKDHKSTVDDTRDAAIALAKAQTELTAKQAEAGGTTLTATQRLDAQNDALLKTAAAAKGPARQAILDYIATLNGIPAETVTEIRAALERGDIDEANRLLAGVSATRTATVKADADTAAANVELSNTANPGGKPRTAEIVAHVSTTAASTSLAQIRNQGPRAVPPPPDELGVDDPAVAALAGTGAGQYPAGSSSSFTVPVSVTPPPVNVTVNTAVLGSRYDIVRAIRRGTRDGIRLAGVRP